MQKSSNIFNPIFQKNWRDFRVVQSSNKNQGHASIGGPDGAGQRRSSSSSMKRSKNNRINRVIFSGISREGDAKYFMSGGEDRIVYLWKHLDEYEMDSLLERQGGYSISLSESILDDDEKHAIDELGEIRPLQRFQGAHGYEILDIAISKDGSNSSFASCGIDKSIFIWDVRSASVTRELQSNDIHHKTNCVSYLDMLGAASQITNGPNILASGSDDKLVKLWDMRNRSAYQPIQTLDDATDSITHVILSGDFVISSSADGRVRYYDVRKGILSIDHLSNQPISFISISNDRKKLLASVLSGASDDGYVHTQPQAKIHLIDLESGNVTQTFVGHINRYFKIGCTFDNQGSSIFTGSEDGSLFIFDSKTAEVKQKIKSLSNENSPISDVSHHPLRRCVVTSAHDGVCRVLA